MPIVYSKICTSVSQPELPDYPVLNMRPEVIVIEHCN
jgi:hypothetical protein